MPFLVVVMCAAFPFGIYLIERAAKHQKSLTLTQVLWCNSSSGVWSKATLRSHRCCVPSIAGTRTRESISTSISIITHCCAKECVTQPCHLDCNTFGYSLSVFPMRLTSAQPHELQCYFFNLDSATHITLKNTSPWQMGFENGVAIQARPGTFITWTLLGDVKLSISPSALRLEG